MFQLTDELTRQLHRLAPDTLALRLPLDQTHQLLRNSANRYGPAIEGPDVAAQVRRLAVSSEWLRQPQDEAMEAMFDDGDADMQAQHLQRVTELFASLQRAAHIEIEPSHDTTLHFDPHALAYTADAVAHAPALARLDLPALEAPAAEQDAAVAAAIDRLSQHATLRRVSIGEAVFEREAAGQRLRPQSGGEPGPA